MSIIAALTLFVLALLGHGFDAALTAKKKFLLGGILGSSASFALCSIYWTMPREDFYTYSGIVVWIGFAFGVLNLVCSAAREAAK